jgi:hypothetical protein
VLSILTEEEGKPLMSNSSEARLSQVNTNSGRVIALIDAKRRVLVDVDLEARVTALEVGGTSGEGGS